MSDALISLDTLLDAVEARILASPALGVTIAKNTLDTPADAPTPHAHKGVAVKPLNSRNMGFTRNRTVARVQTRIMVTLTYQLREDQRTARGEAITLMESIRARLTSLSWQPTGTGDPVDQVRYLESAYGYHPATRAWYVVAETFTFEYDSPLGDGT